jgi:hypothetical protein
MENKTEKNNEILPFSNHVKKAGKCRQKLDEEIKEYNNGMVITPIGVKKTNGHVKVNAHVYSVK